MSVFLNKNERYFYLLNFTFYNIDNLISDQMKQIWINLELHFESYELSNL